MNNTSVYLSINTSLPINNGKTVVSSPHKVYGPEATDIILQLRKRGIDKIVLAVMNGYIAAMDNVRMIANSVRTTAETVAQLEKEL